MDKFEKKQILEEFLIKWKSGRTITTAESLLKDKYNPLDVEACKRIFEKWLNSGKDWKEIHKIR